MKHKKNMNELQYQLIRRAISGDSEAFAELLRQTQNMVYNLAYRMTGNREDAFDISQETFIKVWRALPGFRFESGFSTWVYRIAVNAAKDHIKKESDRVEHTVVLERTDENLSANYAPDEHLMKNEEAAAVKFALGKLSAEHREIIVLREIEGYSYEEISEMLGIETGTVKSRINRARAALCRLLDDVTPKY